MSGALFGLWTILMLTAFWIVLIAFWLAFLCAAVEFTIDTKKNYGKKGWAVIMSWHADRHPPDRLCQSIVAVLERVFQIQYPDYTSKSEHLRH